MPREARQTAPGYRIVRPGTVLPALAAAVAFVAGLAPRLYRLGEMFGGYHGFNEGFYSNLAVAALARPLTEMLTAPANAASAPLYVLVLRQVFAVAGVGVGQARLTSVLLTVLTLPVLYAVGSRLVSRRAGLLTAGAFWLMPASLMLGRNAQTEALYVLLVWLAVFFWLKVDDARAPVAEAPPPKLAWAAAAGVVVGLATLTKQPGILLLAVLIPWRAWWRRSARELVSAPSLVLVATGLVVGGSWYAYGFAAVPGFAATQGALATAAGGAGSASVVGWLKGLVSVLYLMVLEFEWMAAPAVAIPVAVALTRSVVRRSPADKLAILGLAVFGGFFMAFHLHSYYLYPVMGFALLSLASLVEGALGGQLAGDAASLGAAGVLVLAYFLGPSEPVVVFGVWGVALIVALGMASRTGGSRWAVWATATLVAVAMLAAGTLHLAATKWGKTKYAGLAAAVGGGQARVLITTTLLVDNEGEAIRFAAPGVEVRPSGEGLTAQELDDVGMMWPDPSMLFLSTPAGRDPLPGETTLFEERLAFRAGKAKVWMAYKGDSYFAPKALVVAYGDPRMGIESEPVPWLRVVRYGDLPAETARRALSWVEAN